MAEAIAIERYKRIGEARFNKTRNVISRYQTIEHDQAVRQVMAMNNGRPRSVRSKSDLMLLHHVASVLRAAGVIEFQIITKAHEKGGFLIVAV